MGAFLTNVHVRTSDAGAIIARLEELAHETGFIDAGDATPDRTILVLAGDGWVSVYDEATEGQDSRTLDALGCALTSAAHAHGVTFLVHDSDVLEARLFHAGERVDLYNSNPSYFGEDDETPAPKPERWRDVLTASATIEQLRDVLAEEKLFAEDTLVRLAELLGIASDRATVGYNYANKSDARYTTLRLRHAKRPAHERRADGEPKFEVAAFSNELPASVGFPVQVACSVRNVGGASRGLTIEVSGSALALLQLETAQIVLGPAQQGHIASVPITENVAAFPDAQIPAGISGGIGALAGLDPRKMVDAMYASNVHVNVHGRGTAVGEGELVVTFATRRARHSHTMRVTVRAASRKPLRARENVEAHVLEPLDGRGTLVAMASMKLEQHAAAEVAARALARFSPMLTGAHAAIFPIRAGERPRTMKTLDARALAEAMRTEALVTIESKGASFSFGGPILRRHVEGDAELPTLALSFDAARDHGEALALMEEIMEKQRGVQALVVRWGASWPMSDTTPYEIACGVGGQCTLYQSWLERWLRGVGVGTLFLGDALREHARAPARIDVAEGELDAIEAKLAPILPSEEDWRRGIDKMYGRGH